MRSRRIATAKKPFDPQFTDEQLKSLIKDLEIRFRIAHTKIRMRMAHFHNLGGDAWPSTAEGGGVDPVLPPPFDTGPKYQSDLPRMLHSKLKARLCENHFQIEVEPTHDMSTERKPANRVQRFFNDGLQFLEDREQMGLQEVMSDGQIVQGYAVLHWTLSRDIWPEVPEPDYLEAEEGKPQPAGYDGVYQDDDEAEESAEKYRFGADGKPQFKDGWPVTRKLKGWRQSQEGVNAQHATNCAEAGFPWMVEFIQPDGFMFVKDRSLKDGFAIAVARRVVGKLTYIRDLERDQHTADGDAAPASIHDVNPKVEVYGEQEAPVRPTGTLSTLPITYPSDGQWGDVLTIYQVWTRTEFYEIAVNPSGAIWNVVKSGVHPYGMPPFVLVPAQTFYNPDPALMYEPALEGVFRLKPFFDRQMSLLQVISEQIALPYYYWADTGTGAPYLNEKGQPMAFSRDSAQAEIAPAGFELKKLDFELNPAFVDAMKSTAEQLSEASPATGTADFSTDTKPWAIRLQQVQQSVEPGRLMSKQGLALQIMVRNMAKVQSLSVDDGGTGPLYVYGRTKDGKLDKSVTEEITPEDMLSLDIGVNIEATSAAEQITLEAHGKDLIDDALVPLTPLHLARDYFHWEDPEDRITDWQAWTAYTQKVLPGLEAQIYAKHFGSLVMLGQNGAFVGANGQQLAPGQVLQMNGQQPTPPQTAPQIQTPSNNGQATGAPMPGMGHMVAPGTIPIGGPPA